MHTIGLLIYNLTGETKEVAELNDISIYHTPPHVKTLANWQVPSEKPYDLGVVVSFGYFIPPHIISSFQYGAVNVHPSLLPKYRGAAPIQHAIMYGDRETGVTIQELDDREFDAGRILAQEPFDLSTRPPIYSSLKEQLASVGSRMLVDTLRHLHQRKVNAVPQDVSKATKAPKIKKEWSDIDFLHMSAWQAEQMNRAIGEQYPLRTMYQIHKKKQSKNIVIQLLDLHLPDAPLDGLKESDPGSFSWDDLSQSLQIVFGDHSVIACRRFKVENKGVISASDFCNGYQTQGKFGVSLTLDDDLTIEKNKKKRAKMHQYAAQ